MDISEAETGFATNKELLAPTIIAMIPSYTRKHQRKPTIAVVSESDLDAVKDQLPIAVMTHTTLDTLRFWLGILES